MTIIEVITQAPNVEVIAPLPLSVESINSFVSVPSGGTTGQSLVKLSNNSYDIAWQTVSGGSNTNLSVTNKTSTSFDLNSSTGTDVTLVSATITEAGLLSAADKVKLDGLATVATSGSYNDLVNKPTIPAAQINSDWNSVTGVSQILNKPSTFPPSTHNHLISEVVGLQTVLDGKMDDGEIAGGDLTGNYPNPTVHKIHGVDFQSGNPSSGEIWIHNGSLWQHRSITKLDVGLGNVDNTSDVNKPISTATQTALNNKQNLLSGTGFVKSTAGTISYDTNIYYLASNPNGYTTNLGTVTSFVFTNANGFTGSVSTSTTTPTLSLSLQNASGSQAGQLSSADWTTFNNKQTSDSKLTSISGLSNVSTGLVKLTNGVASFDTNSYLTSNQTITVTGDVSGSGSTAITLNLGNNVVSNSKLSQVPTATFKGRITASTGNVEDLTGTQATTLLDTFTSSTKGLVGASGGGTTNFLRADGTWAVPATGSSTNAVNVSVDFGSSFTDRASTVVTGQTWVTATSKIIPSVLHSNVDEAYLLDIKPYISDIVAGVGFTITLFAEPEAKGVYTVMCIGL